MGCGALLWAMGCGYGDCYGLWGLLWAMGRCYGPWGADMAYGVRLWELLWGADMGR